MADSTRVRLLPLTILGACAVATPDPARIDLLSARHAPYTLRDTTTLAMPGPAFARGFLTGEDSYRGGDFVWCGAEPAVIELDFVGARARTLELEAKALIALEDPPIRVDVTLDDHAIGSLDGTFGWRGHSLDIPTSLAVTGPHDLQFTFARTHTPEEIIPGSHDRRALSVSFRALRISGTPPPPTAPKPHVPGTPLRVPAGSAVSWTLILPRAPVLSSDVGGAALSLQEDGASPKPITPELLRAHEGKIVRLWLEGPALARELALTSSPSNEATRAASTPRRVAVVSGHLHGGQRLRRCSTDLALARCCTLSGIEAVAFGYSAAPVFDLVSDDVGMVLATLAATPAIVWWDVGERDAAEAAAWLERQVDVVTVLVADDDDPLWLTVRLPNDHGELHNARDLDLTPTILALAGRDVPPRLEGTDLTTLASTPGDHLVRPFVITWTGDGLAMARGDHAESLIAPLAPPRPPASVAASFAQQEAARRFQDLAWLGR